MIWVFEGIALGKWVKRKTSNNRTPSFHFRRFNLSLMSCSPAELISVSIEQFKFQFNQLYLQTVEKSNHLPMDKTPLAKSSSSAYQFIMLANDGVRYIGLPNGKSGKSRYDWEEVAN